jgi:hypothetical protein
MSPRAASSAPLAGEVASGMNGSATDPSQMLVWPTGSWPSTTNSAIRALGHASPSEP